MDVTLAERKMNISPGPGQIPLQEELHLQPGLQVLLMETQEALVVLTIIQDQEQVAGRIQILLLQVQELLGLPEGITVHLMIPGLLLTVADQLPLVIIIADRPLREVLTVRQVEVAEAVTPLVLPLAQATHLPGQVVVAAVAEEVVAADHLPDQVEVVDKGKF